MDWFLFDMQVDIVMASSMAALRPTRSTFETEMQAGGVGLTQLQYINLLLP